MIQAEKFDARIIVPAEAITLEESGAGYAVRLDDGTFVAGLAVLIATGARYGKLAVPRIEEFEGVRVFYAATPVEARTCTGDPVVLVGGGNSAGRHCTWPGTRPGCTCSPPDRVAQAPRPPRCESSAEIMDRMTAALR